MTPLYLNSGKDRLFAVYQLPSGEAKGTGVLLVPPFGWDDQTSYRARRDWSLALSNSGFANIRIDLPGTGDSSRCHRDDGLVVESWIAAVVEGVAWLRDAGVGRVAVIGMGLGGLLTLRAVARGVAVDDLILWGVPATGRTLIREMKAFGRLEQWQTGEPPEEWSDGELRAGGHILGRETIDAISALDVRELDHGPARALVLGRDGSGPDKQLVEALRSVGSDVRTDPGRGWGAAVARPQSVPPTAVFKTVNAWLQESAAPAAGTLTPATNSCCELSIDGSTIREKPMLFEGADQQLFAILSEPAGSEKPIGTAVLFNAGAIRRIGPNRMWTEAARRWAAAGIAVLRVDLEGIGDASGDGAQYLDSDESFYTDELTAQSRATLALASQLGLPERFVLAGLCSGAFWAFQLALDDPRVKAVAALNPRLLLFDGRKEGQRELNKLGRLVTPRGLTNLIREQHKLKRIGRLARHVLGGLVRGRAADQTSSVLQQQFSILHDRGQRLHIGFSEDEPLYEELQQDPGLAEIVARGVAIHELPYRSHTLKPLKAQAAAHAMLDEVVRQTFELDISCRRQLAAHDPVVDYAVKQVMVHKS